MLGNLNSTKIWSVLALVLALSFTVLNKPVKAGGDGPFPLAIALAHDWIPESSKFNFYMRVEPLIYLPNGDTSVRIEVVDVKTNKIINFGTGVLKKDASSVKAKLTDYKNRSQNARLTMEFNSSSESYSMHLTFSSNVSPKAKTRVKTITLRQKPF